MGCIQSSQVNKLEDEAKIRSNLINKQLAIDRLAAKNEIKMLFLEAGDAGGSELLRQTKLIHHGGYNESERTAYKEIIFSNIIQSMQAVLEKIPQLGLSLAQDNDVPCSIILLLPNQVEYEVLPQGVANAIHSLWHDPAVQEAICRLREFFLNDSAVYYFNSVNRIASPDYLPTDQDILRCSVKTTGITQTTFNVAYAIFNLRGQRSERKKWIHCFENVTAVMFVVNMAGYDEMLSEDESVNRMQQALILFDSICNSRWFSGTSIAYHLLILLLNHIDRFAEKLPHSPLKDYFPDYQGENNYDAACDYILHRFVSLNQYAAKRVIHAHYTCLSDTQQIKFVLSAIQDILLQIELRKIGRL